MLSIDDLTRDARDGQVDTVIVCFPDMFGRLVGKRFHVDNFLQSAVDGTHACNYLLANDIEMVPVPGYKATNWEGGYGDFHLTPDLSTLRRLPWLAGTVMVLCDVSDSDTHAPIAHAPRSILKKQVDRLAALGFSANMATELEFFLFDDSYDEAWDKRYDGLKPAGRYNEDYHVFQTTKHEGVLRAIRNGLVQTGIPVECTKGEFGPGQGELNIRYADALTMADRHVVIKNACKEIAWAAGKALTFMAKWQNDLSGNSAHIHQSLWSLDGKTSLFFEKGSEYGMAPAMRHYLAGLLHNAAEITYFLAPYVNSYKRFQAGSFAPTRSVWSIDNRTAGFRMCGAGTRGIRVECRIGGADLNPYLAFAALLTAGMDGIERQLPLEPPHSGDAYGAGANARMVPTTLREARKLLDGSALLRRAWGDDVVDHYVNAAGWEQSEYDREVTDFERIRGFERA